MREKHIFEIDAKQEAKKKSGNYNKDTYIVVEEDSTEKSPEHASGTFFVNRYIKMNPGVKLLAPDKVQQALRVNTSRTTHDNLIATLKEKGAKLEWIPFLKNGYFVHANFSFGATAEYLLGYYYLQAPLSQLACEVLNPKEGATVLDMAAAPGSKTTYLAAMVGETGKVIALDSNPDRLSAVRNNAERLGLANVICVKKDARFADDFGEKFEYILLDAPCSGNFCSEENWCSKRTIADVKENARLQRELMKSAINCLAPGGRLLYSTCSLEPEEDELIIDYALKRNPTLQVLPLNITLGDEGILFWDGVDLDPRIANTRRFWPHKTGMEGFFMALIEKK